MRVESVLRRCAPLAMACMLLGAGVAIAAPAWKNLDTQQQALIRPALQSQGGNFDALPEARRDALVKGADRWLTMTPDQRGKATRQFQQWQQLSAGQKATVLQRRERFRRMTPEQRKALLDTQKQFLEMPLQQQSELYNRFNELQPGLGGLTTQPITPPSSPATPGTTTPAVGLPSSGGNGFISPPAVR